jgi:DNA-directed RNA polymerase subunit H (RpoH/RPB5)
LNITAITVVAKIAVVAVVAVIAMAKPLTKDQLYLVTMKNISTMILHPDYWGRDNIAFNQVEQKIPTLNKKTDTYDLNFPDYKNYLEKGVLITTKKKESGFTDVIYIRSAPISATATIKFIATIFLPIATKLSGMKDIRNFYLVTYGPQLDNKDSQLEAKIKTYLSKLTKPLSTKTIRYIDERIFYKVAPKLCGVPTHRIMTKKDRIAMSHVMLLPKRIPAIKLRDPQCLWLDAQIGDIVEITGYSYESGKYGNIRTVVA